MPIVRAMKMAALGAALFGAGPAHAQLAISQLVVELKAPSARTADVEIFNDGDERSYVAIEPRGIAAPGTKDMHDVHSPDPEKLGLLVSPARMVLEPRERKTMRVAVIGGSSDTERVYRITVKPVSGKVEAELTGLKLLVGYDLLVLVRPAAVRQDIAISRQGRSLTLTNRGNSSVELADGKQCDAQGKDCRTLPAKRLYAGASWQQELPLGSPAEYRVRSAEGWSKLEM